VSRVSARTASGVLLSAVIALSAVAAVLLQRNGHTQGDDFALYLRQARSLFDGDIGEVVADNRFAVLNAGSGFSPIAYPWGWPLLLSPFVRWWGLDYDRLKLLEVVTFCAWMVLVHGIVRRRIGRGPALAVVAIVASAPLFLAHTDQLLSEFPHAVSVALFVWWLDRVRGRHPWTSAAVGELIGLGALGALAFNFRRESLVLVGVIFAAQVVDVVPLVRSRRAVPWRAVLTPYLGFVGTVVLAQLLLPSTLIPDGDGRAGNVLDRLGDYTGVLTEQLGFGDHPVLGVVILLIAAVGVVTGCRRRPPLDVPLATLAILSAAAVSTHVRMVDRYYFQVAPWIVYFGIVTVLSAAHMIARRLPVAPRTRRGRGVVTVVALVPFAVLCISHAAVLRGDIADAREFDRLGRVQVGPTHPDFVPLFSAVRRETSPDDVVAYFRARTMTLLTDRRAIQTMSLDQVLQRADWFAQLKGSTYWQPSPTELEARAAGLELVWRDDNWLLWRVERPDGG
jgi:hypothetical protein